MKRNLTVVAIALILLTLLTGPAFAQKTTKAGAVEIDLYGGGTFDLPGAASFAGISDTIYPTNSNLKFMPGRKIQPIVGGGLAVSLVKILWVYGDYSYVFPDRTQADAALGSASGTTTTSRHYWQANGGFQVSFPTVQRVVPYLEAGLGLLHQNYNTASAYSNVLVATNKTGNTYRTHGVVNSIVTPHVGGGVRIFVKERSGFKFSVDGYYGGVGIEGQVPGTTGGSFPVVTRRGWGRLTAGYFFRLGRH